MALFNLGVAKIEVSPIAADGGVGTTFAALGLTQEGTTKINFAEPTTTDLMVEELDTAADSIVTGGEKTIEFVIANPDEDTLVALIGGTKAGTGATTTYTAPATATIIERSVKITPKKGLGFIFPRVLITARPTSDLGKTTWMGVTVTGKVLAPTKAGVSDWSTFRV